MITKRVTTSYWWVTFFIIVIIARLMLTGDRDILVFDSPHDDYWYIHSAFSRIWGGFYNEMTLIHLPVYAIWLDILSFVGLPARLGIDIGWIIGSSYLTFAIFKLTESRVASTFLFVFLLFHPYTIIIFDKALAETFLVVMSSFVLAAGIEIWTCRRQKPNIRSKIAVAVYGVAFAVAYHTRNEGVVLLFPLALLLLCSFVWARHWWHDSSLKNLGIKIFIFPILCTVILGFSISGLNYLKWGVFARHELAMPGYQHAIAALNAIDIGRTRRYITVTRAVLSAAYSESKTFGELRPFMEGAAGRQWIALSEPYVEAPGEIGNGWFYWALRDVAGQAGWHKDAVQADKKYDNVGSELDAAFAAGRLKKKKYMLSPFIDPDYGKWLPHLPASFVDIGRLAVYPEYEEIRMPQENGTLTQYDKYVAITGRRVGPSRYHVAGWVIAPPGTLVGLGSNSETVAWQRIGDRARPDAGDAWAFDVASFGIQPATHLRILSTDGRGGSISLANLSAGHATKFTGDFSPHLGIDLLESNLKVRRADRITENICAVYHWLTLFSIVVLILATFISFFKYLIFREYFLIMIFLLSILLSRISLFSLLDASSWSGLQARYMLPVVPVIGLIVAIAIAILVKSQKIEPKKLTF